MGTAFMLLTLAVLIGVALWILKPREV